MSAKTLDAREDFCDQAPPDIWNALFLVVGDNLFEVTNRGLR